MFLQLMYIVVKNLLQLILYILTNLKLTMVLHVPSYFLAQSHCF